MLSCQFDGEYLPFNAGGLSMKRFAYKIEAVGDWGESVTEIVHASTEQAAEDLFKFRHAAENLEIVEIKYLGI